MSVVGQIFGFIPVGQAGVERNQRAQPLVRAASVVKQLFTPITLFNEYVRNPICAKGADVVIRGGRCCCRLVDIDMLSYEFESQSVAIADKILKGLSNYFLEEGRSGELDGSVQDIYFIIGTGLKEAAGPVKIRSRMERLRDSKAVKLGHQIASYSLSPFVKLYSYGRSLMNRSVEVHHAPAIQHSWRSQIWNVLKEGSCLLLGGMKVVLDAPVNAKLSFAKNCIEPLLRETSASTATTTLNFGLRRVADVGTAWTLAYASLAATAALTTATTTTVITTVSETASFGTSIATTAQISSYVYIGAPIVYHGSMTLAQACRRKKQMEKIKSYFLLHKVQAWKESVKQGFKLTDAAAERLVNAVILASLDGMMEILSRTNPRWQNQLEALLMNQKQMEKIEAIIDRILKLCSMISAKLGSR